MQQLAEQFDLRLGDLAILFLGALLDLREHRVERIGFGVELAEAFFPDLQRRIIVAEPQVRPEEQPDPNSPDPSRRPISELDLSVRSRRIVDLLKMRTIGDLATKTEAELLACPNFGQTSLNEIKTKLDELGLSLRG